MSEMRPEKPPTAGEVIRAGFPDATPATSTQYGQHSPERYATYLWECGECGQKTYVGHAGGILNPCLKRERADEHCGNDGHDMNITVILAGTAEHFGTAASLEGRKPGELARENAWQQGSKD